MQCSDNTDKRELIKQAVLGQMAPSERVLSVLKEGRTLFRGSDDWIEKISRNGSVESVSVDLTKYDNYAHALFTLLSLPGEHELHEAKVKAKEVAVTSHIDFGFTEETGSYDERQVATKACMDLYKKTDKSIEDTYTKCQYKVRSIESIFPGSLRIDVNLECESKFPLDMVTERLR